MEVQIKIRVTIVCVYFHGARLKNLFPLRKETPLTVILVACTLRMEFHHTGVHRRKSFAPRLGSRQLFSGVSHSSVLGSRRIVCLFTKK